jgi:putative membrane protein
MHWMNWTGGGWVMMTLWWLIILSAIVIGIKWLSQQQARPSNAESALDILKQRYARGEISRDQFDQMKRDVLASQL